MNGIAGFLDWKRDGSEQQFSGSSTCSRDHVTVAVEGYLYNQKEIREALTGAGHRLQSGQIAELFQLAYLHWGDAFVERLAGAFAFVIWDSRERRMILGRDQLGMKNLYYSDKGEVVPFGTEIKKVLDHPSVTRNVAGDGVVELLMKGPYFSPGHAVFQDVQEVKPGHLVICTPAGTKSICYWDLQSHLHEDSLEQTVGTIDSLLNAHVSQWSEDQTPPTVILSGGLDSSGLTGMMHRFFEKADGWKSFSGNTKETYEAEDLEDMDFVWVNRVAEHLGMTNVEVLFDLNALWELNTIPRRAHDLPTQAKYEASSYQIYKEIQKQNDRIVIGEGADELFASNYWFYRERQRGEASLPWLPDKAWFYASPDLLESLRAEEYVKQGALDQLRQLSILSSDDDTHVRMRELSYLTIKEYLPYILRHNERMATAAGVELRMPFVDPRLAQYVWNIPWEMKNYRDQPKGVLRQVFRSYLPDFIIDRKKSNVPMVFKSNYSQPLREDTERLLQDRNSPLYDLVDREQIRKSLDEKVIEQDMYMRWRLDYYLQIDHWMREYQVQLKL
ncbi:asparagine synthase (glutamine-hydrolyzing) [Tumebacillus sp. ITR2]|uniref:asparagine synthase (glutamine-hydrolyzing) n=1 Tax=Tumebacillus amylolyticus TaxID=2801339 RepID=A0ABS1JD94_9BACL|nr:asparagine synthase (glutamine-hydrolyzing) [Tumebacillus amylolyticus]MBL0388246.1 asparagine synthase (glutamine-hydrolyzing) [Tumebacillus amylolyticus]